MRLPLAGLVLLASISGCAKEPFVRAPLPVLVNPDPVAMANNFGRAIPRRFISDDTIIIKAPFRDDLAILGVLRIDRQTRKYELVGLNHVGLKLFDMAGDRGNASILFALPPLMAHKDVLLSMAKDVERMYLDLVPDPGAKEGIESREVSFSEKQPEGVLVYKFGEETAALLEKKMVGCFGAVWRVRYYQYSAESGGLIARGIVMDNSRFHYRIIVKNRDVEIAR